MIPPLRLRTKLALSYAVLFAILLTVAGVAVYRVMALGLTAAADDNLVDHCAGLWGYIRFHDGKPTLAHDPSNPQTVYFLSDATRYYQLYDADNGQLLLESEDSSLLHLALPVAQVRRLVASPGIDATTMQGVPLRFHSALFRADGHPYLLRVGVPVEHDLEQLALLQRVLWLLLPITTLIAVLAAWWMARKALRPLQDLENEAHAISINQLHRRLRQRGTHDELDALAATFNQVFARLEDAVHRMKQFAATMSHELRTPLTVLQGEAEVALLQPDMPESCRLVLGSQLEEFRKLKRLVNSLLTLARAEAGEITLNKRDFDLAQLALTLCDQMEPVAKARGVPLRADCPAPIITCGDVGWLERVILNLLDNAIKFTPSGGAVQVTVRTAGTLAILEVSDTGIGIAEQTLPHVFDPFYQAGNSEPKHAEGAGLGLALAKWVIEAHGGAIQAASRLGKGSVFTVTLPLVPTPLCNNQVNALSMSASS